MSSKRILIQYPYNPFTKAHGVHTRYMQIFKYLKSRGIQIDMISHKSFGDPWNDVMVMSNEIEHMIDNLYVNDKDVHHYKKTKLSKKISGLISRKEGKQTDFLDSNQFPDYAYQNLQEQYNKILKTRKYDMVLITYPMWANLIKNIDRSITTFMTIEDFMSLNYFDKSNGKINIGNYLGEEIKRTNYFDKVICISKEEMAFFERFCKKPKFYHIPHMMPLMEMRTENEKTIDITYVGSNNQFNRDGMIWFFEKVVPFLNPDYKITIIGKVNEHLDRYKNKYSNYDFVNFAEELEPYYHSSKITICPMFGGTGLKIKVIESLSFGLPCVTTDLGIVGMEDSSKNGCIVTNNAELYAMHIRDLIENQEYRNKISREAYEYFQQNYTEEEIFYKMDDVFLK